MQPGLHVCSQRPSKGRRIPMSVGGSQRGSAVPPRRWTRRRSPMSVDWSRRTWPTPSPRRRHPGISNIADTCSTASWSLRPRWELLTRARLRRCSQPDWSRSRRPMPAADWRRPSRRWRAGWRQPRPPRHSPKHFAVRRMPMPARPLHRRCRRPLAGCTRAGRHLRPGRQDTRRSTRR